MPEKIMFPGAGAYSNPFQLIDVIASKTLCNLWTALRVRDLRSIRTPFERTLSARGKTGGDLPDVVPTEFPSTLSAHCMHTGNRTNRETGPDTVRDG
jgi:hypothetical protein